MKCVAVWKQIHLNQRFAKTYSETLTESSDPCIRAVPHFSSIMFNFTVVLKVVSSGFECMLIYADVKIF
jgi:hypothetical protein